MSKSFGIYIHIPFCTKKCPYCDFNTYALKNIPETEYVDALIQEIKNSADLEIWKNRKIATIYFGGGTPSILKPESIDKIILNLTNLFPLKSNIEITLEANPGDLNFERLKNLKNSNINRLSFGVQTFNDAHLKTLGRWHSGEDAKEIFDLARKAKFNNISLDLMFALPGQSKKEVKDDLNKYINLEPEHISTYELTIERGTPFFTRYHNKNKVLPSHAKSTSMYDLVIDSLKLANYNWYEVSNFSKKDKESKHNLAYWEGRDYLGIGASAHSFYKSSELKGVRNANISKFNDYINSIFCNGHGKAWSEDLKEEERLKEIISLSLRTSKGISYSKLNNFRKKNYPVLLQEFIKEGLIENNSYSLVSTRKGRYLADSLTNAILDKIM